MQQTMDVFSDRLKINVDAFMFWFWLKTDKLLTLHYSTSVRLTYF